MTTNNEKPLTPNYTQGVGRLVTDRFDFQAHVDGDDFRHHADQIDLVPVINIQSTASTNVQDAIQRLANAIGSPFVPDATTGSKGVIQLAGDLGGVAANVTVTGLQGRAISAGAPTTGQVLTWSGTVWTPTTIASSGGTVTSVSAGTGISITSSPTTTPVVNNTGILNIATGTGLSSSGGQNPTLANTGVLSLTAGSNITLTGTAQNPIINASGTLSITLGGDVTGPSSSNTVVKIQNISVLHATPSDSDVLTYSADFGYWQPVQPTVQGIFSGTGISVTGGPNYTVALSTPISVSSGGTGTTSLPAHGLVVANGTSNFSTVSIAGPPAVGAPLTFSGSFFDPAWQVGALAHGFGGTDVTSPGSAGNVLKSNGTSWTSAPLFGPTGYIFQSGTVNIGTGSIVAIAFVALTAPANGFWNIQANFSFQNIHGVFGTDQITVSYGVGYDTASTFSSGSGGTQIQGTIAGAQQFSAASKAYRVAATTGAHNFYALAQTSAAYATNLVTGIADILVFWSAT